MVGIKRPAVFTMAGDVATVRGPLRARVVALLANRHDVEWIEEQGQIALVILPVVSDWAIRLVALADQEATASRPLACVVVAKEDDLPKRLPLGKLVERPIFRTMPLSQFQA